MTDYFTLPNNLFATLAQPVDFVGRVKKQYRVIFNIYDRSNPERVARRYAVFINKRYLVSTGWWFAEDSQRSAIEYAKEVVKRRFVFKAPSENAAYCRGKICKFTTISRL